MTEEDFRRDGISRAELSNAINCKAYRIAVEIVTKRRQMNESAVEALNMLASDAIVSVRMNSQRIGMEGFINDLHALCEPPAIVSPPEKATYQEDEAAARLEQYDK